MRWAFSSRKIAALLAAFFVLAVGAFALAPDEKPQQLPLDPQPLTIVSQAGAQSILIEVADEGHEREVGLMYRTDVPSNQGMLFDFNLSREVTMWMRNTPTSLDILFINDKGIIITIAENTVPLSKNIIASKGLTRFALELVAGSAVARGIKVGDRVHHRVIDAVAGR
jgi:uncharacterized protein